MSETTRDPALEFSKAVGYEIGLEKSTAFLYTSNNQLEKKIKKEDNHK